MSMPTGLLAKDANMLRPQGVWFVYGYDTMPYPLFISNDELKARQYQADVGYYTWIKFWEFNSEFGR